MAPRYNGNGYKRDPEITVIIFGPNGTKALRFYFFVKVNLNYEADISGPNMTVISRSQFQDLQLNANTLNFKFRE